MKKRIAGFLMIFALLTCVVRAQERIEQWKGKTAMVFTPHPDDDLFGCGGTLALLVKNGNKIIIVIYTNDNKGDERSCLWDHSNPIHLARAAWPLCRPKLHRLCLSRWPNQ